MLFNFFCIFLSKKFCGGKNVRNFLQIFVKKTQSLAISGISFKIFFRGIIIRIWIKIPKRRLENRRLKGKQNNGRRRLVASLCWPTDTSVTFYSFLFPETVEKGSWTKTEYEYFLKQNIHPKQVFDKMNIIWFDV